MTRFAAMLLAVVSTVACAEPAPARSDLTEGVVRPPGVDAPGAASRTSQLPGASRAVLEGARLPLLLPREPELLSVAVVTAGPHFTALSARVDELTVSISGTDSRFELAEELPPPEPSEQVRGRPATFTVNDGIRSVSWDEASIAWSLDVECYAPDSDPRCTGTDFIRDLAEGLELIGGGP